MRMLCLVAFVLGVSLLFGGCADDGDEGEGDCCPSVSKQCGTDECSITCGDDHMAICNHYNTISDSCYCVKCACASTGGEYSLKGLSVAEESDTSCGDDTEASIEP